MKWKYHIRKTKEYSVHETSLCSVQSRQNRGVFQKQMKHTTTCAKAVNAAMDKNDKDKSYEMYRTFENISKLQATWFKEPKRTFGNTYPLEMSKVAYL